jgi:hypothetical protein
MPNPRVDILYFDGCPNWRDTKELVERIAQELAIEPGVRLLEVPDGDAAIEHRFLGSPTVRVEGADAESGADARREYVFACRMYRTEATFRTAGRSVDPSRVSSSCVSFLARPTLWHLRSVPG